MAVLEGRIGEDDIASVTVDPDTDALVIAQEA
jgi:hypothetical protein